MRKAEKTDQLRETVVPCVRAPFELECFSPLEVWFFQTVSFFFFSFFAAISGSGIESSRIFSSFDSSLKVLVLPGFIALAMILIRCRRLICFSILPGW